MKRIVESRRGFYGKALAVLVIAALIGAVVGCGIPDTMYSLTVTSTAGGVVTAPGEDTFEYSAGTVVELEAVADEGHRFLSWIGDVDTIADVEAASTTITLEGDYSITAKFEVLEYTLTISSTDGGSVTTPGEGTLVYDMGTVVDLEAEADEGYRFMEWTGDISEIADVGAASTTITLEGDYSITANFEVLEYTLTIDSTEGGSVTIPGEGTFAYDAGTVVDLAAEADDGYKFIEWTGDINEIGDVGSAETTIIMYDSYSVWANFSPLYNTSNNISEGLSNPMIHASDGQGRIYFTEYDTVLNEGRINRFDPHTEAVVRLIEHQDADPGMLAIDGQGNLYYVLRPNVQPRVVQIRKLPSGETESQILFATEELDQWLISLAVDWSGNVYFGLQSWDYKYARALPGSELCRIPSGTTMTETLLVLEDSLRILSITGIADAPSILYFTSAVQGVARIYRFNLESKALDTILERTTNNSGMIAYLAARADGELYYLYRQRSNQVDPVQFGYLEIGRFTLEALEAGQPPELLVADELDQAVWVWFANISRFFAVSDSGDVFFEVLLHEDGPFQVCIFWFDPSSGSYTALVEGSYPEVLAFTFVLDNEGNVYYSTILPGTIVRINR